MSGRPTIPHAGVWRRCERCGELFERRNALALEVDPETGLERPVLLCGGSFRCPACEHLPEPKTRPGTVHGRDLAGPYL